MNCLKCVIKRCILQNSRLLHFVIEIVSLARSLADARENGKTAVLFCHIIDKFHYQHRFADAGTAEKTYFTALGIGADKVDYLDTCFKYFG